MNKGRTPEPFLRTQFNESQAEFSPDGRWLAYRSDDSGKNEVYLSAFPAAPGKWQVSTSGGERPRWNPNGREIFYRDGDKMMVVDVESSGSQPVLGRPRLLFERSRLRLPYDVSPDGQRFVMIDESEEPEAPTQVILVVNWGEELKRLVPTN